MRSGAKWCWILALAGILCSFRGGTQEVPEKKPFFLPKNPPASAYILGRLSNPELLAAPRSEFVYVAILERKGLDRRFRLEAIQGLAKLRKTDPITELAAGIAALDAKGEASEAVLRELAPILTQFKPEELRPRRDRFKTLVAEGKLPLTRRIALAALVTADGSADSVWKEAGSDPARVADLAGATEFVRDPSLRTAFYPKLVPLIDSTHSAEVREAAISALPEVGGKEAESFERLAAVFNGKTDRSAAIASLARIPKKFWKMEMVPGFLDSVLDYLKQVPTADRTEPAFVTAVQFGTDLSSLLPGDRRDAIQKTLRGLGPNVFIVRTIYEQMLYDRQLIVVETGKSLEIVLQNDDAMPHNLVVVMPGAVEEIGLATEKMQATPDGQGRLYVPDSPKVLQATRLIDPGQKARLAFTAPSEPGEYSYVCTYPGHWRRMVGTLAVVKDVEAYLSSRSAIPEPKITEWKIDDLVSDLAKVATAHPENGKPIFTQLACAQCHRLGTEGYAYGPDLTDVFQRYKGNRGEVLRQVLEPSLVISNRYQNVQFELKSGDTAIGMVMREQGDEVTIQTGPSDALVQTLKKSEISGRTPSGSSPMPVGLLNTLTREQICDLLAYLESGGKVPAHQH